MPSSTRMPPPQCRKHDPRIAQQFTAGKTRKQPASPVGAAETGFSRASGTRTPGARDPRTEVLGYCRVVPPALPGLRGRRRCGECAPRTLHTYAAALPQIWIPPGRHHPPPTVVGARNARVHPGELHPFGTGEEQAVLIHPDAVARSANVPGDDVRE